MTASRLSARFQSCKARGRAAFVAYLTAGDPSLERTLEACLELEAGGADVVELGVPFSDPLADGPVIQRASERALRSGTTLRKVLDLVAGLRQRGFELPIVLFSYLNPLHRYGLEALARDARAVGVDGALVTDLPPEEAEGWIGFARQVGLDTVFLAAPTSPDQRLSKIAEQSRGFLYAVSRTGVTGERSSLSGDARPLVSRLRALTPEPIALGFGISTPEQVAEAAAVADGVVVGSALVSFLEQQPHGDLAARVRWLSSGLGGRSATPISSRS